MPESDIKTDAPDNEEPGAAHLQKPLIPSWQLWTAYVLIALPAINASSGGDPYWATSAERVRSFVLVGVAIGAALFVVRRQPRNAFGWFGLVGWGGLCVVALATALLK